MEQAPTKNKSVRQLTEQDRQLIYKLAAIHCSNKEIASIVGLHIDTLQRTFKDILAAGRESGKGKLRRKMWESALSGNVTMMIWLSKNHLGMTDHVLVSEDKQPLPWSDDEDIKSAEPSAPTDAEEAVVFVDTHDDLEQLAEDLRGI